MPTTPPEPAPATPAPFAPAPARPAITLWIGLDWADDEHMLSCRPADGSAPFTKKLSQQPAELDAYFLQLHQQYPHMGVCVEQSRGPLIYSLLKFDFVTIYPVNPRSLAEYRRVFKLSGAKSDPTDADLAADLAHKHHEQLRALRPQDATTRQLALLCEHRRTLVADRTALTNRLGATLKCYYPLAEKLFAKDLDTPMALTFLRRWPTLAALLGVKPHHLRKFFYGHHSRSEDRITERLAAVAAAKPLTTDPAILEPMKRLALTTVAQLETLQPEIAAYDQQIAVIFSQHANHGFFAALPGAGAVLGPRLAAAFGTLPDQWRSARDLQDYSGVAPVTKQSGKQRTVHFRWVRPKFLHQTVVEFASCSIGQCEWAALLFKDQCARGHGKWTAIRVLAYKWLRILWRCWKDQVAYDETRYLRSLQKRGVKLYEPLYAKLPPQAP